MQTHVLAAVKSFLLAARTRPIADLLSETDEFEKLIRSRSRARVCEHLALMRQTRVRIALLANAPVSDCIPLVEQFLLDPGTSTLRVLSLVGAFAVYCEEQGMDDVGAKFLRKAINRGQVERDGLSQALQVCERNLNRMG